MSKKKTWIKVHTGLTNDPAHRERMGIRVWLFMWLVDHADHETGIVYDFTDAWCGGEMELPQRTIEDQRQRLEADGYIACHQGDQCQHVRILKWRNPKEVNPDQINVPNELGEYGTLRTPPRSKFRTPTIDSFSHESSDGENPALPLLQRHWAFMGGAILAETYVELYEQYGADAFEQGLIAVVEAGGGHKMNKKYLATVLANKHSEVNALTEWDRGQLRMLGIDL